ncbi:MAG: gliding motility-associated C-terminal domain-containing protein [Bacteroidales bacterium]|nr:gliding motility-associated C-terminal domain-containing protein [Bacteroidales bacterium]
MQPATSQRKAIRITATDSIWVLAEISGGGKSAMLRVLPEEMLGSDYVVQASPAGVSTIVVVATRSGSTRVSVNPTCPVEGHSGNWRFSFVMAQGQCYMLRTQNAGDDFSGTVIETQDCAPVAVFMGSSRAATAADSGNMLVEQAWSTDHWGSNFVLVPSGSAGGDLVGVTTMDTCRLWLNGGQVATLSAHTTYNFPLLAASSLKASSAVEVIQYPRADTNNLSAMFCVHPLEWMWQDASFWTATGGDIAVVAQSRDVQSVTVDGRNVGSSFSPLQADSIFSIARLSFTGGAMGTTHKVKSASGVVVCAEGAWQSGRYAYEAPEWNAVRAAHFVTGDGSVVRGGDTLRLCLGDTLRMVPKALSSRATVAWLAGDGTAQQNIAEVLRYRYSATGRYRAMLILRYRQHSCARWADDTLRLTVIVGDSSHSEYSDTTCTPDYLWQGRRYSQSGLYNCRLRTVLGCDSSLWLRLTVGASAGAVIYDTLPMSGLPYNYNGMAITFVGDDTVCQFRFRTWLGCDSLVSLHLHLLRTSVTTIDTVVCDDAMPVTWRGHLFLAAGTWRCILHGAAHNGADSVLVLRLAVGRSWHDTVYDTICSGSSLTWAGRRLFSAGAYTWTGSTVEGCDSVVELLLWLNPSYNQTLADTIVENRLPHFFAGRRYTASVQGETIRLHTVAGCDSVIVYSLHVWRNARDTDTVVSCAAYYWCGQWLSRSGLYHTSTVGVAPGGADSIHYLLLSVPGSENRTSYDTSCSSYRWHNNTYTVSGHYLYRYTTPEGCEVVDTLHLTIGHPTSSDTSVVACDRLRWNGIDFTVSGDTALHVGPNALGCDSVATIHVQIYRSAVIHHSDTIDEGDLPWRYGGVLFYGQVSDTILMLHTAAGCDSMLVYTLSVTYNAHSFVDTAVCDNDLPIVWHGHVFRGAERATDTIVGGSWRGADSLVTYIVRLLPTYFFRYNDTLCEGETYTFNGGRYTQSGHYRWYTHTAAGCDSINDLIITFMPVWSRSEADTVVQGQLPWHYGGVEFTNDVEDTLFRFRSVYGCDSLVHYSLTIYHDVSAWLDSAVCSNQLPVLWLGELFWSSGTRRVRFPGMAASGADSVVIINLTVYPVYVHSRNDTICEGQSVVMGGVHYAATGYYESWAHTTHGCDSLEQLTLTVNPVYDTAINDTILENQLPWSFAGRQFFAACDSEAIAFVNRYGCDSTLHYSLYVYYNFRDTMDTVICGAHLPLTWQGEVFDSIDFTGSDTAAKTIVSAGVGSNGEDSVLIIRLMAYPVYDLHYYDTVCEQLYASFDGHLHSAPGNYTYRYHTAAGCDSVRTLHLYNTPAYYDLVDTQSICEGEAFNVEGYSLSETCDRTLRLHTVRNCDSIVQLHLDVWPVYNTSLADTICDNDTLFFAGAALRDSGLYRRILRTVHGCDSVMSLHLSWYPHLEAAFTTEPSVIDPETKTLRLRDVSLGASCRRWSLPSYSDTSRFLRYTIPTELDSFNVLLQVWNPYGCTDTAQRTLHRRYSDLWVPNAFTPDEPTNNRFAFFADSLATLEVEIYTRSGLCVARLSGVDCSWDGTCRGAPCPQGAYVYIAHFSFAYNPQAIRTKKGSVLLIR